MKFRKEEFPPLTPLCWRLNAHFDLRIFASQACVFLQLICEFAHLVRKLCIFTLQHEKMHLNKSTNPAIGIVDDHAIFRRSVGIILSDKFQVVLMAENGIDFIEKVNTLGEENIPEVIILDLKMPEMNGLETLQWISQNMPSIKVLILSMYEDGKFPAETVRHGAKGYLTKNADQQEIEKALTEIINGNYYFSNAIMNVLMAEFKNYRPIPDDLINNNRSENIELSERELEFLKLSATEMTYHEIAQVMKLSPRTIDGLRNNLFEKLNVKNRVTLALYAIKNGVAKL
jgi:two-component system, NarL family, invasion response regulator UvrY